MHKTSLFSEVKMSPSVFSKGLIRSVGEKALIGFEFEVLVPVENVEIDPKPALGKSFKTLSDWLQENSNITENTIDSIKREYVNWAKKKSSTLLQSLSDSGVEKFLSLYSEYYAEESLLNLAKFIVLSNSSNLKKIVNDFVELEDGKITDDVQIISDHVQSVLNINSFINDRYKNVAGIFSEHILKYGYSPKPGPANFSSDARFDKAKEITKDIVQKELAKTNVITFGQAKMEPKNIIDWYIEPDATIIPDEKFDQVGVEIVSPPLEPDEALRVLEQFYKTAATHGWKTNGSTGLHINISMPKKLDILKLSLFLGDKYVLKSFGREENAMANSVLDRLRKGAVIDQIDTMTPENVKRLAMAANYYTDDHYSSISFETNPDTLKRNKYVSFRHIGGDYLNDIAKIKNMLGRFVSVMLIAADPNVYQKEYMKKINKLLMQDKTDANITKS